MLGKVVEIFLLIIILYKLFVLGVPNTTKPEVSSTMYSLNFIKMINDERIVDLEGSDVLHQTAQKRACDMNKSRQWSHDGLSDYFKKTEYAFVGENLAKNFTDEEKIFKAWMNSESHKRVMLNTRYKFVGVGNCGDYTVAHFGGW